MRPQLKAGLRTLYPSGSRYGQMTAVQAVWTFVPAPWGHDTGPYTGDRSRCTMHFMGTQEETLQIELEDVGGTSWWAGVLTTLGSQYGSMTLRFVGRIDGEVRYKSDLFASPRTVTPMAPEEAFAPGMTESLVKLRREIEKDGWVETARGPQPWAFNFARSGKMTTEQ